MPNTTMQMPWNEATGLRCVQALHTSHEYHNKEWYDSVAILQDGVLSYAKLLLIFWQVTISWRSSSGTRNVGLKTC